MLRLLLAVICLLSAPALAEPISPDRIQVLDGDTIKIDGSKPDHRLVGFNAPETLRAKTDHERRMGGFAKERLQELVQGGSLDYSIVECSCKSGTAGTRFCNHGRFCGVLKSNGIDVGQILISEELAAPFHCGPTRCPKTPNPWR
ncbi:thermonuclease family protein [Tardiphaga sp. vice352]|uniref:thermonuclease family protein n=1 Tax=unclassified Tardiphaga TaxID=2631404 RepID=UPI0011631BDA|nr:MULTISPECIES: thermonuclease family protein [unclassified Tardiphaga]QDM14592.1 thermonuclease family protein [Tardiphaga sp. vice278]QDM29980.1 thermonuclease family protein [Tardiphaga sp. vice352]